MNQQSFVVKDTFNIDVPPGFVTRGFSDDTHPNIPKQKQHVFTKEILRDTLAYLAMPDGDGLYFSGHYGTGKTSTPYQVAARLNWPIQSITAHERMEFDDLVGLWKMVNGSMQFMHGPLSIAMQQGHILIINEIDRASPGQLAGLHDVLEGHPLIIASNGGEIIHPHEYFRIIVNGNSKGSGDSTGLYQGVNQLDVAFMDRFRMVECHYPDKDIEHHILELEASDLPEDLRHKMVAVANQVRTLFIGGEEVAQPLTITMSTRALVRWARLTVVFRGAPNAIGYALNQALIAKAEPEQRIAIERIAMDIFGDTWSSGES